MGTLRPMSNGTEAVSVSEVSCVLWCAHEPPRELLTSLTKKGVTPTLCRSAFGAMAEICLLGTIGAGPSGGGILLISEPAEVRGKRALLTACQRYAPWLRLWVYQREAPIQLRPLDMDQLGLDDGDGPLDTIPMHAPRRSAGSEVQAKPRGSSGSWTPRLSGEGPGGSGTSDNHGDDENGHKPAGLLTDDELSMLLADDSDLEDT